MPPAAGTRRVYLVIACDDMPRPGEAWRAALGAALGPLTIHVFETPTATLLRQQSPLAARAHATLLAFGHDVVPCAALQSALVVQALPGPGQSSRVNSWANPSA